MFETQLTRALKIQYPIFQAPMAGGVSTPELVAAVSNAGGLGNLGGGYLTPEQLRSDIQKIRQQTDQPFGVNLFVPEQSEESEEAIFQMTDYLNKYRDELGTAQNPLILKSSESFEEQVQVLLEERVSIFSFTFGIPSQDMIQTIKQHGIFVIGTATTVDEAKQLEVGGVDAIVAQGSEAGGHRGTFLKDASHALIGTMAIVPQIVDHVSIPVIAAGGVMDGRGLAASLLLGADAVQMGTAFLACPESGAHEMYKQKILSTNEDSTQITRAYSGKAARGIETKFMIDMHQYRGTIPAYPIQNAMTRDIRQAAAKANSPEYMSLWAGQGLRLANDQPAASIVKQTIDEASILVQRLPTIGTADNK
ncbi:nitronate monooxygenase [Paenibacillus polymyxa]|uniref:NAD(P)H-dependent flavin oxidoreductase n=1 Tax=Paenibacillus jamilae TaxID=114136 RepID=UPI0007ABB776|nr:MULTISPECIES: nitronate monooxygenase [Paenibacillus]KZE72023.1 nitronate monooxygenase [Paenibacillus jamilae]OBA01713.1 nitronate monooxygenase [Paenibacillus polymyxa]